MRAVRIPREQRILLFDRKHPRRYRFRRWCGELPEGGVLTASGGLAAGCCGHYSFFRWRFLFHRHPGDRPVPDDMQAALRGEAPVPEWFKKGDPRHG